MPTVSVLARRRRPDVLARGHDAAATLRRALRRAGRGTCAGCGIEAPPSALDVDHIVPLAHGGGDVTANVQPLCRPCHRAKTRDDMGYGTLLL